MRAEAMRRSRGARFGGETLTHVDADAVIRPLKDWLVIKPDDVFYSRYIIVKQLTRPLRGTVLAVGPGIYPKRYDHPEKHKRTKTWDSTAFRPTEVRVGDLVELGGYEIEGFAFEGFYWGDQYCIWASERDVCGIVVPDALDPGAAAGRAKVHGRQLHRDAPRRGNASGSVQ